MHPPGIPHVVPKSTPRIAKGIAQTVTENRSATTLVQVSNRRLCKSATTIVQVSNDACASQHGATFRSSEPFPTKLEMMGALIANALAPPSR
jgi:hypothetical protein